MVSCPKQGLGSVKQHIGTSELHEKAATGWGLISGKDHGSILGRAVQFLDSKPQCSRDQVLPLDEVPDGWACSLAALFLDVSIHAQLSKDPKTNWYFFVNLFQPKLSKVDLIVITKNLDKFAFMYSCGISL